MKSTTIVITVAIVLLVAFLVWVNWPRPEIKNATPLPAPAPDAGTGGGTSPGGTVAFNPKTLADALHEDITCVFCTRNNSLYEQLLALPDVNIKAVHAYWEANHKPTIKESLPVAIAGEWWMWGSTIKEAVSNKFKQLNLK